MSPVLKRIVVDALAAFGLFCVVGFAVEAVLLAPIGKRTQ